MIALLTLLATAWAGWSDDARAAHAACATSTSEACEVVGSLSIRESRAGIWFVQDDRLEVDHLQVLLGRLLDEGEPGLRLALATGAARLFTDADPSWHGAWADLAASAPDGQVRGVFVSSLRRAPMSAAGPGLRGALAHAEPVTRRDAAAMMGGHAEATAFVDDLLGALDDADPVVRKYVVRALGHAGDPRAAAPLQALLERDGTDALAEEITRALGRLR